MRKYKLIIHWSMSWLPMSLLSCRIMRFMFIFSASKLEQYGLRPGFPTVDRSRPGTGTKFLRQLVTSAFLWHVLKCYHFRFSTTCYKTFFTNALPCYKCTSAFQRSAIRPVASAFLRRAIRLLTSPFLRRAIRLVTSACLRHSYGWLQTYFSLFYVLYIL